MKSKMHLILLIIAPTLIKAMTPEFWEAKAAREASTKEVARREALEKQRKTDQEKKLRIKTTQEKLTKEEKEAEAWISAARDTYEKRKNEKQEEREREQEAARIIHDFYYSLISSHQKPVEPFIIPSKKNEIVAYEADTLNSMHNTFKNMAETLFALSKLYKVSNADIYKALNILNQEKKEFFNNLMQQANETLAEAQVRYKKEHK